MTRKQLLDLRSDLIIVMGAVATYLATDPAALAFLTQYGGKVVIGVGIACRVLTYYQRKAEAAKAA